MVIQEENHTIKPFLTPEKDFRILGVNNKDGLFDAYAEKGANIKQPYQKVENGWLAYNPYRVNVGSVGLKTDKQVHEWISNAYVVFSCRQGLLPEFLYFVFATDTFNKQIRDFTSGSVRQNLSFDILETLQIPLPSLPIQNRLVSDYTACLQQASEAEAQASKIEQGIEAYLLDALGITFETKTDKAQDSPYKFLKMVDFKDMSRWDASYLQNYFALKSKYALKSLETFLDKFMTDEDNKSLRFESFKYPEETFYYLGMEHIEKETGHIIEMPSVKGDSIKSQTIRIPPNYFLYGKLRSYLNKYWFNNTDNNKIIVSSEFFVFSVNDKIDWQYFLIVLSSIIAQKQISNNTSGVRMPRMNEELFKDLAIPLPPLPIQNEIAAHINTQKTEAKRLRAEAQQLRQGAKEAFEKEIFN